MQLGMKSFNSSPPNAAYMRLWIVSALAQIWLVAYLAPTHYLNQCLVIVNWAIGSKLQWNCTHNKTLFIYQNAPENIVCEMVAILSWVRGVDMHKHMQAVHIEDVCNGL